MPYFEKFCILAGLYQYSTYNTRWLEYSKNATRVYSLSKSWIRPQLYTMKVSNHIGEKEREKEEVPCITLRLESPYTIKGEYLKYLPNIES